MGKILIIYLIIINLIGFMTMYIDKEKAKQGKYRIPEATLWKISFIGGAIGTTLGMTAFRHKTKHTTFRLGFPLIATLEIIVIFWGLLV